MNKEERELLELAAKAVGYAALPIEGWTLDSSKGMRLVGPDHEFVRYWNPRKDAGDALRLAVAIGAEIYLGMVVVDTDAYYVRKDFDDGSIDSLQDAITLVAAEIGRNMP